MPPAPRLKVAVETLRARGLSINAIAAELGMNLEYARKLTHERRDLVCLYDQFAPTAEDDQRHCDACLAEGGFPLAYVFRGNVAYLRHDGGLWRHLKRRRAA